MNDDSQILIARLLTHQTLRRDDKLVKRVLSDELFRAEIDARLLACGLKLLDNVYADHVTLALTRTIEPKIFGSMVRVRARVTWSAYTLSSSFKPQASRRASISARNSSSDSTRLTSLSSRRRV